MKLVVVIPPSEFLADDRVFPYLGPVQIATAARDIGHFDVEVVDLTGHAQRCPRIQSTPNGANNESARGNLVGAVSEQRFEYHDAAECEAEVWRNAEYEIALTHGDVYGVCALSCHVSAAVRILNIIKRCHPKAHTVLGGPHAAMAPEAALGLGFDHVVADLGGGGGGEAPALRLLARLARGLDAAPIFKAAPNEAALHRWPWPDRRLVDIGSYNYLLKGLRTATIVTQRGCSYACSFCSHTEFYRRVDFRDAAHVEAELDELRRYFAYHAVMLYDDETNLNKRHFDAICDVLQRGEWTWRAFIKSNLFTDEQAKRAAAAGAVQLCTGGESMDPAIKRHIAKKSTVDDDTRFVRLCLEHGIEPKVFTMVGLPGESNESASMLEAWLLARIEDGLKDFDVTVYTPYPGTPISAAFERDAGVYIAPGGEHGSRLVKHMNFASETTHYKGRGGEYTSRVETFDPRTGKVLLTADEIVAWRERIDRTCRAAVAQRGVTRITSNREEG